ncbi:MAG: hybrid sensor histidine kinase/response regulator [Halorhodospira sp.]
MAYPAAPGSGPRRSGPARPDPPQSDQQRHQVHGGGLDVTVADSGPGLPQAPSQDLFQAFTRDETAEAIHPGVGLGLAICRELAQLMGGSVWAEDNPGGGAIFGLTARLPVCTDTTQAPAEAPWAIPPSEEEPPPALPATSHPLTVLIAEDDPTNALLLQTLFERAGCQVRVVSDGEAAIADWQRAQPDLLLLDLQMPRADGAQATACIRSREQQQRRPRTPIAVLTAHALEEVRKRALQAGCDYCLVKPLSLKALQELPHHAATASS